MKLKGEIIYAFVKNKAKNGDYYWVKAYVKPIVKDGKIVQFTSYRKPMNEFAKNYIDKLYMTLVEYERMHTIQETLQYIFDFLENLGLTYEQFIDRLSLGKSVELCNVLDVAKIKNAHIIYKYHIINAVKNGNFDIKVSSHFDCEFGKIGCFLLKL